MRYTGSVRGFVAGVFVGALIGSAGMAAASFGYNGWKRFSDDFRGGYIAGFLDMANLARNLQPGGWVDKRYPYLPHVELPEWIRVVDSIYADPANQNFKMTSILQAASTKLVERYGEPVDPMERARIRSQQQLESLRRRLAAQGAKDGGGAGEAGKDAAVAKPVAGATAAGKEAASAAPEAKAGAEPGTAGSDAAKAAPEGAAKVASAAPRARKWCRCDGTDPKAERQARGNARRAAEAALDEELGTPAAPPAAPATK